MSRSNLILWLVLVVAFAAVECTAACAIEECNQGVPPCHRHHSQSSSACSHQVIVGNTIPQPAYVVLPMTAIASLQITTQDSPVQGFRPMASTGSPPGAVTLPSSVLRI